MTVACIAGMHRSGTSLVARTLQLCGLYLGEESDIAPAAPDNPEGYWENIRFLTVNEQILERLKGGWDLPPNLAPGWENSPEITALREEAVTGIHSLNGQKHWGWKDPRNSLTLPFWQQLIPDLKVVICLRDPRQVAQSLERRGAASQRFSMNLWRAYYEQVLASVPPRRRIVTHYDAFFHDCRAELRRLLEFLEMETDDRALDEACQSVNSGLRHNKTSFTTDTGSANFPEVAELYASLCAAAGPVFQAAREAPAAPVNETPSAIPDAAATASPASASSKLVEDLRRRVWGNAITIQSLQHEIQVLQQTEVSLRQQVVSGQQREASLQQQVVSLQHQVVSLQQQVVSLQQQAASLQQQLISAEAELTELHGSFVFRLRNSYHYRLDRLLPESSWGRQKYEWLVRQIYTLLFEGTGHARRAIQNRLHKITVLPPHPAKQLSQESSPQSSEASGPDSSSQSSEPRGPDKYASVYADLISTAAGESRQDFVALGSEHVDGSNLPVKAIAFYLPQYHPIPENDRWWGRGFTEWTNVSKAVPQFVEHYQPRLPGELGFYDLRLPEVQIRQVELARQHGLYGFAFHYYWFNGKRLLEKPLDNFLADQAIDFKFCICWANENWTRRWDGQENEILIAQKHGADSDRRFIQDIIPVLEDKRYICIDGRPLIIVYRANILPNVLQTVERWRETCEKHGLGNPYLVAAQTFNFMDPRLAGFDAAVEFPPHTTLQLKWLNQSLQILNPQYRGNVFSYPDFVDKSSIERKPPYKVFKTVFPSWDNEARKPGRAVTFTGSTPAEYQRWLARACELTLSGESDPDKRLVFINAWNEWGEAAYLEPDRRYGYAYLDATARALAALSQGEKRSRSITDDLV